MMETSEMIQHNAKFVEWTRSVREARARFVREGAEFFHALWLGEQDPSIWRGDPDAGTGYVTFEQVLTRENLVTPDRYSRFKLLLSRIGWDRVRVLGVDELMPILGVGDNARSRELPDVAATEAIVTDAMASFTRNGTPPSKRQVDAIVRRHYVRERVPATPKRYEDRLAELEAQLIEKNREVKTLTREVKKRDKRILELESQLARAVEGRVKRGGRSQQS